MALQQHTCTVLQIYDGSSGSSHSNSSSASCCSRLTGILYLSRLGCRHLHSCIPFWNSFLEENLCPSLPFPVSRGCNTCTFLNPLTALQNQQRCITLTSLHIPVCLTTARKDSLLLRTQFMRLGPFDQSKIISHFNIHNFKDICKVSLPHKITFTDSKDENTDMIGEGQYFAYDTQIFVQL